MGLEEAVVNQATVWPESGADRTASSRENPVPSTAPNQYKSEPNFPNRKWVRIFSYLSVAKV